MAIKIKFWCRLFGHDFRCKRDGGDGYDYITPSEYCRHCGLSKSELLKPSQNQRKEK